MARLRGALLAASLSAVGATHAPTFAAFVELHGRTYGAEEYENRRALYESRVAEVHRQNNDPGRLWSAGINHLSDWTNGERAMLRGWDGGVRPAHAKAGSASTQQSFLQQRSRTRELPSSKSWAHLHAAQNVFNQGDCGSCWAIAAATVLQAHTEIHGQERSFSVQEIVSCTPNPRECGGAGKCEGATLELAMDWVLKQGCSDGSEVPYQATSGECQKKPESAATDMSLIFSGASGGGAADGGAKFGMTGWEMLAQNEYEPLMRAIVERGPVGVSVSGDNWFNYQSGIFNGCGKDAIIDHAVVLLGYGEDDGQKTWLIQNSWGSDWGEGGHIRLLRHDASEGWCGMDNKPQLGTACKGDNDPVRVCGMCGVLYDSVVPHFGS